MQLENKILFVTDYDDRVLQRKHMYDSMDYNFIKVQIEKINSKVIFITFDELRNNIGINNIVNCTIIYTTSQMFGYKKYVEETMTVLDKTNILVPKLDVLLSHENKSYQELYLNYLDVQTNIPAWSYGDLKSFKSMDHKYPLVIKMVSGSQSAGVKFCNSEKQALKFIKSKTKGDVLQELFSVPIKFWPFHIKELNVQRRFLVQEKVDNRANEWRIEWHNGRILGFYRELKKNSQYASGGSIQKLYDIPVELLNYIEELSIKIGSPHIIYDVISNDKFYLVEFSGIHIGQNGLNLFEQNRYYKKVGSSWKKIEFNKHDKIVEEFYVHDISGYIKGEL